MKEWCGEGERGPCWCNGYACTCTWKHEAYVHTHAHTHTHTHTHTQHARTPTLTHTHTRKNGYSRAEQCMLSLFLPSPPHPSPLPPSSLFSLLLGVSKLRSPSGIERQRKVHALRKMPRAVGDLGEENIKGKRLLRPTHLKLSSPERWALGDNILQSADKELGDNKATGHLGGIGRIGLTTEKQKQYQQWQLQHRRTNSGMIAW